jgi:hypothetical protein
MFHRPASGSKVDSHWQCGCATNRARPAWGLCCWQARLRSHTCQHSRPHPPATAASKPPWDTAIRQAHVVRWAERIGRDKQTNQPLLAVLPRGVREDTGGGSIRVHMRTPAMPAGAVESLLWLSVSCRTHATVGITRAAHTLRGTDRTYVRTHVLASLTTAALQRTAQQCDALPRVADRYSTACSTSRLCSGAQGQPLSECSGRPAATA